MPILNFSWDYDQGYDIHVLRNNQPSQPLEEIAMVIYTTTQGDLKIHSLKDIRNTPPSDFNNAEFIPQFIRTLNSSGFYEGNNIEVNKTTGVIRASPINGPKIQNFIIEVVLSRTGGQQDLKLRLRVHVHDNLTNAWLTPGKLSIMPDIEKGINELTLQYVGSRPVSKVEWFADSNFSSFILLSWGSLQNGSVFNVSASLAFRFRGGVFLDPLFLKTTYSDGASPGDSKTIIPAVFSHQLNAPQFGDFTIPQFGYKRQYRFSVYGAFDDGTIGDITNYHGVSWDNNATAIAEGILFDNDGAFEAQSKSVGKTIEIKAKLPPSLTTPNLSGELQAQVEVKESWLKTNKTAVLIPGSPTHLSFDQIPNVLFISEGFTDEDEFRGIAQSVYGKLNEPNTSPWNHLFSNAMNAWMLFEKSEETAASILYECATFENVELDGRDRGDVALSLRHLVTKANDRLESGGGHDLSSLIDKVVLPLPADATAGRNTKLTEWRQLYDPNLEVSDSVFDFWSKLGTRRLFEERNTAFGFSCGEKPKIDTSIDSNKIILNSRSRLSRNHVDLLLSRVRDNSPTGNLIGEKYWGRNLSGEYGKDYGLIVFLVGGVRQIGTMLRVMDVQKKWKNQGIAVGLVEDLIQPDFLSNKLNWKFPFFHWKPSPGAPSFEIDHFDVPTEASIVANHTIAHELSHSFNIDDEYAIPRKELNIPQETDITGSYNLQLHDDLLDGGEISGDKIKWRWPRIKKAGVLKEAPAVDDPAPNNITVRLKVDPAAPFEANEVVHLRQKDIINTPLTDLMSPKLTVLNKLENDMLVLQPVSNENFNWENFKKDSLLILPVKASPEEKNNPDNDEYAEVLSPIIRHWINKKHRPMTKFPCNTEDTDELQKPVNLPSLLDRPNNHRLIVGLYSGGMEYSCGIYHPTGECIMRVGAGYKKIIQRFCHVCRYSLVDQIDPTQHGEIDKEYEDIYPQMGSLSFKILKIVGVAALIALIGYGIYKYYKYSED